MIDKALDKINEIVPEKWKWVLSHEGFRKYFKNTGWMFFAKIFSLIISFITIVFVVRRLGPESYGQLSYAISFVGLFSFIATMGLDQILFRDLVKNPDESKRYLGSAFLIKLIAGFLAIALCLSTALFFSSKDVSVILIFIIASSFIFNSFQVINYEFQARVKSKYPSIASLIIVLVLSILKIIIVASGRGVIYLALILLLESILYALFFVFIYRFKLKERILKWEFNKKIASSLIKDSWPIILSNAFIIIYSRIDQVMIKGMIDVASVGLYDAAVRIAEAWYFIPGIIVSSLFPAIINAKLSSDFKYNDRLKKILFLLVFLSLLVAVPVAIFSKDIIISLYGLDFIGSIPILKIYIWAGIGMSLSIILNSYLVAENFRRIIFISSFIAMTGNVILNLILIPRYGIAGAAWATFFSYLLGPISLLFFNKTRGRLLGILGFYKYN